MLKEKKYQARQGFVSRNIAGEMLLVPVGELTRTLNGMVMLNETGLFLWECLSKPKTKQELIKAVIDSFEVSEQNIETDVDLFLEKGVHEQIIIEINGGVEK